MAHVVLLRLRPRLVGYSPEKAQAFHHEVIRRLEALPGVQSLSLAKGVGLVWRSTGEVSVRVPGEVPNPTKNDFIVSYH